MSSNFDTRNVTVDASAAREHGDARTQAQIESDLERQRAELAATIDQLYARVQPAALAQEAKEEASARFASFKQAASLTLQDAAGGNVDALKKVGFFALSALGTVGIVLLLGTCPSRRSRRKARQARRVAREAAAQALAAFTGDEAGV